MGQPADWQVGRNPLEIQGQAETCRDCIKVIYHNRMRIFSGVTCQKFRDIVHGHVIPTTLHWAKEVMVKIRHADRLMKHQVIDIAVRRMVKSKDAADRVKGLRAVRRVIADHFHWSVVILYNQCILTEYGGIGMQVKF